MVAHGGYHTKLVKCGVVGGGLGAVGRCPSEYWLPCMGPAAQRVAWVGRCLGLHGMDRMQQAARRTMSG